MKIKSLLLLSLLAISSTSFAQEKGEELFKAKCAMCHMMEIPKDSSTVIAPPARGLMFHLNEVFSNNEEIEAHINDITLNPTKEKAVLRAVRRFGLMPSQKDLISEDELQIVSKWMIDNLSMSKEEHQENQKKHNK